MRYDSKYFDYIDSGAILSAQIIVPLLHAQLRPSSVVDVGCGRGGWLSVWKAVGCTSVRGVDGSYVDRKRLHIHEDEFQSVDLAAPFDLERRFDLIQCLEVAEHLPQGCAATLLDSIVRHGDRVLFSAAVPGQGGTHHVNEQPLEYWRALFAKRGYTAFDALRPQIHKDKRIEPWYRYNLVLYVNEAGRASLPTGVMASEVPSGVALADFAPVPWRLRKAVVRCLPRFVIDEAASVNAQLRRLRSRSR